MDAKKDTIIEALLEHLIENGAGDIATVFARTFELAMQIERERFLHASHYERNPDRQGYANGYKPKRIDTPAGSITVDVPKTAGHVGEPFYPQSLERGRRSVRAVMVAVAEMYIKGVSTRDVEAVMREFGIESLSSAQVSRASKLLDDELAAWRTRPLAEIRYLILDARYEKMRDNGVVRDAAVLSAIGIGPDERRRVLGVSVALSEAEVHWRAFLESLHQRGLRGVEFIVSDDHAGLHAARRAVFGAAHWQRCQFHLAQNAIHHAPNHAIRKRIGAELRTVWNANSLAAAQIALITLVNAYRDTAPKLADWLERNIPEGLTVFTLPEPHQRRLRTSNPMERGIQQELKRRTTKIRVFPNEASLERLVSAVLVEIDEKWAADTKGYIKWDYQDA
ncbi:IS256 family transposase [Acidiphilium acidophilum]|uniref:Mutator family transposase n=4 Tax=Acetobacterales TaxID=3120395 RepID=A0AAW9DLY3_ACIAO|nr:IS256 family transposase [Acidiphilium acidophilum]MDX5929392.1 IS256 family transposase [Acidiphilium acidophilum]MDX5932802.1 IS256 family transposase [Acidiphilium acidophilum]